MDREEEKQRENGTKAQGAESVRAVEFNPFGFLCALTRPLKDSGMMPGTDRYVELEQRNAEVKRTLRDV